MIPNLLSQFKNFLKSSLDGAKALPKIQKQHVPHILETFNKREVIRLSAFALIFLLAGGFLIRSGITSGKEFVPDYGSEYVEGLVGQPRFINPVLAASSGVDSDLSRIIFAQLLKFDKNLNLAPDLAESLPEVSADQKVYKIKLKPDLKWEDGKPIRADDVLFTIQTIQNPDYESPLRANWSRVKVEKIDDLTVQFTLREISASFITNFTLGIIPKHIWDGLSPNSFRLSDNNLKPIGSGPFVIREIKKTSEGTIRSLTLRSNDQYYSGRPFLNRMIFRFYDDYDQLLNAYQSKDIQGLGYLPFDKKAFLEESDKYSQHKINLPQYQAVFFNLARGNNVTDKSVRQALWLATNRDTVVDEVYMGFAEPALGPIIKGNLGYNPEVETITHTNIEEAVDILNRGGWIMDPNTNLRVKNGKPLEFNLATNSFVLNVKTAQILKSQWEQLGARVNLVIVSASDLEQQYIRTRNFDALLFAENTGADPDPFAFWHSSQSRDPGLNLSGFSHGEVDRLLTAARQTNDVNVRRQNYEQFQKIVVAELPAIFLNSAVYVYNTPKKLQGVDLTTIIHPSERFMDVQNWYIETKRK